ncbi:MAG: glycosyltransferase family 2 protein [Oscillospiraceae bacterium]|nr:glycosyltransferase family 2 protein [Oscillospiraceae bacterium]
MKTLVSLIVPVYNVEGYIDQCLQSISAQTYPEIEIILINDGSTDGSLQKCNEWKLKDSRISVIDKRNEGVSVSRNLGIEVSRGEVIGFIDPDDWIESTYVEKLLAALEKEEAEYAECDIWRYDNRTGKKIYRSCGSRMGVPYTLREHMKYGPTASYKALSRRSLWERYSIRFPSCSFESPAVYPLILALSRKTAYVPEALYYYRRFREDSLIENGYANRDGSPNNTLAIEAMDFLVSEFKRCGIYKNYAEDLEGIIKYRFSDILAMQFHRKSECDFKELVGNYRKYLERAFPEGNNSRYLLFGGYNLNRILLHTDMLEDPYCRFNFSSIISLLNRRDGDGIRFTHRNRYREIMLNRESDQAFWDVLAEIRPDYLFMDLIEERFNILLHEGSYYTVSDAFEGSDHSSLSGTIICRSSEECAALWRKAFFSFVQGVSQVSPDTQIIVIEDYLSERVGDIDRTYQFEEIDEIRSTNKMLRDCYRYIRSDYGQIAVIRVEDIGHYFTDEKYEYGAIPSHLNEIVNQEIAIRIERIISRSGSTKERGPLAEAHQYV